MDCNRKEFPISVLIICPTRELACQVAAEAMKLLKHHPSISAQVVIGGTSQDTERKRLLGKPCQVNSSFEKDL